MKSTTVLLSILLLCTLLLVVPRPGLARPPTQTSGDWPVPGGRFFTQAAGGEPGGSTLGFAVVDNDEARFWSDFQRLGGLPNVGYPISRRFVYDGFVTQAFQKLVLQWRPEVGQAWPVNVFDELSRHGFDERLASTRQTPYPLRGADPSGASWAQIIASRQGWLTANRAIQARYVSVRDPLNVFGLPVSRVEDMGNHYALRTQRAVFQQWKEAVPWAAQGQVTIANGGDIAREMGWLPQASLQPESGPGQTGGLPLPTPLACDDSVRWFFADPPAACPAQAPIRSRASSQAFEHGFMIRTEAPDTLYIFFDEVFYQDLRLLEVRDGSLLPADAPVTEAPPAGYQAPGARLAGGWTGQVRARLGWATGPVVTSDSAYQCQRQVHPRLWTCYVQGSQGEVFEFRPDSSAQVRLLWHVWPGK